VRNLDLSGSLYIITLDTFGTFCKIFFKPIKCYENPIKYCNEKKSITVNYLILQNAQLSLSPNGSVIAKTIDIDAYSSNYILQAIDLTADECRIIPKNLEALRRHFLGSRFELRTNQLFKDFRSSVNKID
jgi:hypothetical protein